MLHLKGSGDFSGWGQQDAGCQVLGVVLFASAVLDANGSVFSWPE